jgi:omega-6 fatty acid desaturase (delta-12 desaturase)
MTPPPEASVIEKPADTAERSGSLKPVIDAIPDEVYENPTWKGMAYFYRDVAVYLGLLAALVFVSNVVAVLALEIVMAFAVSGLFIIGHDSAHGALFSTKKRNNVIGRLGMLPSLHVYDGWKMGHNRVHHTFTVRQGYDFVWHPATPQEWAAMGWWRKLVHRLEWSWLGAGVYYAHQIWIKKMMVGKAPARFASGIRRDRWVVTGFFAGMVAIFSLIGVAMGESFWGIVWLDLRTVVLPFVGFCWVIGAAVHVHHVGPDIRWWKKAEWTKFKAQMEGTTVLRVPKGMNFFLHWIMVHVPHHVDMRVPMYNLESAADAIEEAFPGTVIDKKFRLRDFRSNTKACKLYDFDNGGRWYTYAEGRALVAGSTPASGEEVTQES